MPASAIEGHFEEKNGARTSPGGSCYCTITPRLTGHLQPRRTYLGFQYHDHPQYSPELAPLDYHLFPGLKKKQLKGSHFWSEAEFIAAAETWLEGQTSEFTFFQWLAIVRATG
jgi:hypothetical protein